MTTNSICSYDNISHAAKGTGYFFGAAGLSLTIAAVAALASILALSLFGADVYFCYEVAIVNGYTHLLWAIPVTCGLLGIDVFIIIGMSRESHKINMDLVEKIKSYGEKMKEHFAALTN